MMAKDERHFLFVRYWPGFTDHFPYDRFNSLSDSDAMVEVRHALAEELWRRRGELTKARQNAKRKQIEAKKARAKQVTGPIHHHQKRQASRRRLTPCERFVKFARLVGWHKGGFLSTKHEQLLWSPRIWLAELESKELADDIVSEFISYKPANDREWDHHLLLNPRYGSIPIERLLKGQRASVQAAIQVLRSSDPDTWGDVIRPILPRLDRFILAWRQEAEAPLDIDFDLGEVGVTPHWSNICESFLDPLIVEIEEWQRNFPGEASSTESVYNYLTEFRYCLCAIVDGVSSQAAEETWAKARNWLQINVSLDFCASFVDEAGAICRLAKQTADEYLSADEEWKDVCTLRLMDVALPKFIAYLKNTSDELRQQGVSENQKEHPSDLGTAAIDAGAAKSPPAHRQALLSYRYAEVRSEKSLMDREAYRWFKENGYDADMDMTGDFAALTQYELPSEETWKTYVSRERKRCGTSKNRPRAGRTSRSIVTHNEI
jgi:hypothetical protein